MANAIFYHKPDSDYDDLPEQHYHFPKQYLSRVQQTIGDRIVYYGPSQTESSAYNATCRVLRVREDRSRGDHFYADVDEYLDFDRRVLPDENGGYERKLFTPDGRISGGRAVQAVRLVEPAEFVAIVDAGLSDGNVWPDRSDDVGDMSSILGFGEKGQKDFERPVLEQLSRRRYRDAKFKQHIRKIYDRTCAFTGLRLINGKGRPEVEAAHIMPVEKNGPDSIRNGIALSGTVHWMFDRGLLSLTDDFTILRSRQINHDVSHLLNRDMKARVPDDSELQPHPYYLQWHRAELFKE